MTYFGNKPLDLTHHIKNVTYSTNIAIFVKADEKLTNFLFDSSVYIFIFIYFLFLQFVFWRVKNVL